MSINQMLDHRMGRLYPWVFHAPKSLLGAGLRLRGQGHSHWG